MVVTISSITNSQAMALPEILGLGDVKDAKTEYIMTRLGGEPFAFANTLFEHCATKSLDNAFGCLTLATFHSSDTYKDVNWIQKFFQEYFPLEAQRIYQLRHIIVGTAFETLAPLLPFTSKAKLDESPRQVWTDKSPCCGAVISSGTYGKVYKAIDLDGNPIAIKKMKRVTEGRSFALLGIRELRALQALKHPNIVALKRITKNASTEKNCYNLSFVFEYLPFTLGALLRVQQLKWSRALKKHLIRQMLVGLHYMHSMGFMHRDLKVANILVDRNFTLKLADFGASRMLTSSNSTLLTNMICTLTTRSPEQLLGSEQYSFSSDLWSAGCVAAEIETGKALFDKANEIDQIHLIFKTLGTPNEQSWPGVSDFPFDIKGIRIYARQAKELSVMKDVTRSLAALLVKILVLDPAKRLTSAEALDHFYFYSKPFLTEVPELTVPDVH